MNDAEAKLLLTALPSGIIAKIKGATLDEAGTRYHTTLRELIDKGYVAEHTVGVDSDVRHPMIAYYITQAGYDALLDYLPDDHPLQACSGVSVNIRKGMSNEKVHRMARIQNPVPACPADHNGSAGGPDAGRYRVGGLGCLFAAACRCGVGGCA